MSSGQDSDPTLQLETDLRAAREELRICKESLERLGKDLGERTAELHESKHRIQAILDSAADSIISIDRLGRVEEFNKAAERTFGYTRSEIVGRSISMLMPEPFRTEHDGYLRRYAETRNPRIIGTTRQLSARRKDGSVFPMTLTVNEIDELDLYTGTIHDMSRIKAMQREILGIASEEQRRIGQELHDALQSELTGLGLLAQNLTDALHEAGNQEADVAARVAAGISAANSDVQSLARNLIPAPVHGEALMSALEGLTEDTDAVEGLTCTFECPEPVSISDDETALQFYRIAQEAVTNALKHAQASRILIRLIRTDDTIRLEVQDNGIGIERKRQPKQGNGLKFIRYRCDLIGGTFEIGPSRTGGALVVCIVPRTAH